MFPTDEAGFAIDDQYYIGSSGLLVKPVTEKGAHRDYRLLRREAGTSSITLDLPCMLCLNIRPFQVYYDYFSSHIYRGNQKNVTVKAELHQIPLFIRGGSIVPTRERPRRSSPLMKLDPFTLRVAPR